MEVFTLKIRASAAQGCLVPIRLRLSQQVDTESEDDFFGGLRLNHMTTND